MFFWRLFFQHMLLGCKDDAIAVMQLKRLTSHKELADLVKGLALFLKTSVGPWLTSREFETSNTTLPQAQMNILFKRVRSAEKALAAAAAAAII